MGSTYIIKENRNISFFRLTPHSAASMTPRNFIPRDVQALKKGEFLVSEGGEYFVVQLSSWNNNVRVQICTVLLLFVFSVCWVPVPWAKLQWRRWRQPQPARGLNHVSCGHRQSVTAFCVTKKMGKKGQKSWPMRQLQLISPLWLARPLPVKRQIKKLFNST